MATVAIIGTCDTKLNELLFLRDRIQDNANVKAMLIDVGWKEISHDAIVPRAELLAAHGGGKDISKLSRGEFIKLISSCASEAVKKLHLEHKIDGVVSAGGSGGTSIASAVMRDVLPIGFPKLIVSTIASGDTAPIVGETDIMMMPSIVDVAGLNHVLQDVFSTAGAAIASAALSYSKRRTAKDPSTPGSKKRVGITMFGVTTPGVDAIRKHLESNYAIETYIFHATGHGGKAMERLIRDGQIDAVIDLTTTEICDFVMDGVMSAGPERLQAAVEAGIPNIVSLGATDMANFGAPNTVPNRYKDRKIVEHNPIVTLVRSSPDETKKIGEFICDKLKKAKRPEQIQLWIPKGGVSMLSVPGAAFADEEADAALFETVKNKLDASGIKVVEDDRHVNNEGFAQDIADALVKLMGF